MVSLSLPPDSAQAPEDNGAVPDPEPRALRKFITLSSLYIRETEACPRDEHAGGLGSREYQK